MEIELTGLKGSKHKCLINDEDYSAISNHKWFVNGEGYAQTRIPINGRRITFLMHRIILGIIPSKIEADHINRNRLDNRKENLRATSDRSQSMANRSAWGESKYKGVSYRRIEIRGRTYTSITAKIRKDKKLIHLGTFKTEVDAAIAYDEAAKIYHKEFANLNFK